MADEEKAQGANDTGAVPKINWDDSQMESTYANVCNASFTREEVVVFFGINQAWQRNPGEVKVQLSNRMILSPFAAKRLTVILAGVLKEYEKRFGAIELEARVDAAAATLK